MRGALVSAICSLAAASVACSGGSLAVAVLDAGDAATADAGPDAPDTQDDPSHWPPGGWKDAAAIEGGAPSNPGKISCGSAECATPDQFCCTTFAASDAGATSTCTASANLSACQAGARRECDETADCAAGNVCCAVFGQGPGVVTQCRASCAVQSFQACRTDGECRNAQPCAVFACGGATYELCERPPGCQ